MRADGGSGGPATVREVSFVVNEEESAPSAPSGAFGAGEDGGLAMVGISDSSVAESPVPAAAGVSAKLHPHHFSQQDKHRLRTQSELSMFTHNESFYQQLRHFLNDTVELFSSMSQDGLHGRVEIGRVAGGLRRLERRMLAGDASGFSQSLDDLTFSHLKNLAAFFGEPGTTDLDFATFICLCVDLFPPARRACRDIRAQLRDLKAGFKSLDNNSNGKVKLAELDLWMMQFGEILTKSELEVLFEQLDADKNEEIEFHEFVLFWLARQDVEAGDDDDYTYEALTYKLNKRDQDLFLFSTHDFFVYSAVLLLPMFAFFIAPLAYRPYTPRQILFPIMTVVLPIYVAIMAIAFIYATRNLDDGITIVEGMSPLMIYILWALATATVDAYTVHEPIHFLSSSVVSGPSGVAIGNAFQVKAALVSAAEQWESQSDRSFQFFNFFFATILAVPHALASPLYRLFYEDDQSWWGGDSWYELYISFGSVGLSVVFVFYILVNVGWAIRQAHTRLVRMRYFTAITSLVDSSRLNLPFVNLHMPNNIISWLKLRTYLQVENPDHTVYTTICLNYLFVVLFALVGVMSMQWFAGYLEIGPFGFVALYDIIVLGSYASAVVTIARQINETMIGHVAVLRREQWRLELNVRLRGYDSQDTSGMKHSIHLMDRLANLILTDQKGYRILGFVVDRNFAQLYSFILIVGVAAAATKLLPSRWDFFTDEG